MKSSKMSLNYICVLLFELCLFLCVFCVSHRCVKNNRRISREWRQKIESWLQANEQDEKLGDEHKRRARRLTGNRRSFENDSGL